MLYAFAGATGNTLNARADDGVHQVELPVLSGLAAGLQCHIQHPSQVLHQLAKGAVPPAEQCSRKGMEGEV